MRRANTGERFQILTLMSVFIWFASYVYNQSPEYIGAVFIMLVIAGFCALILIYEGTEIKETPLSRIEILEVFEYHDEPLLVSGRGNDGKTYLGVMIKDDKTTQVWMYAELDEFQQKALELGVLPLRETFTCNPTDHVLIVRKLSSTDSRITNPLKIRVSALTEDMLPTKDSGNV